MAVSGTYYADSSAIEYVIYNAETNTARVKYTSPGVEYTFRVSPSEMDAFLAAPSKGKHVAYVWRVQNRLPGY